MPVHSKFELNSLQTLTVMIDLLALSTLAKVGKKKGVPLSDLEGQMTHLISLNLNCSF